MKQQETHIKASSDQADDQTTSTNDAYQIGLDTLPEILKQDLDKNLCDCNCVPKSVVIKAICNGADTFMKVRAKTYASAGNGCCREEIERLVECLTTHEDKSLK
ncbi:MAG: bacterioferritin-associated ferredoxin [Thiomicrorhabdus sp.]|nr:MAG: bacterioferritin-associated ferredoxin [Thiomicrorhabdus sp.]